ncbi:PadR family transcriptional regulator [uncultured Enorma sp.]|uniref:PadR family transcriptional regulator n=1 Tax=uncultured Enorma sp. TaxID=1714346 RepID=UPI00262F1C4F|nr:PadR family transcriptional regulator [uncultured Enorma sp.]
MEAQLKRGFIEAGVLATVAGRESYGYQIVKDAPAALELTESTLYPVLKRLEQAGCITARSVEHNGRLRKYYRITDAGRARIEEFLAAWPAVQDIYRYVEGAQS